MYSRRVNSLSEIIVKTAPAKLPRKHPKKRKNSITKAVIAQRIIPSLFVKMENVIQIVAINKSSLLRSFIQRKSEITEIV